MGAYDRFLEEIKNYYVDSENYHPKSELQIAIYYQKEYFDFYQTYEKFLEDNLLQDFVGHSLWEITDFCEYVQVVNEIIDKRGMRFNVHCEQDNHIAIAGVDVTGR